jgi:hypothetical protein
MRLPLADMKRGMASNFSAFENVADDGALIVAEIGLYCMVSTTLNGLSVRVSERE